MLRKRHLIAAIAAALLLGTSAHAANNPYNNAVVFGDSLSDAGQTFSASLNSYSKFTTNPGNVTVQNVAAGYGFNLQPSRVGGSDYAYGGAGVVTDVNGPDPSIPTLTQQINGYLANGARADPRSLYMVWGGANDIQYHLTQFGIGSFFPGAGETAAQATANVNAAATQELALIAQLKQAGAKYVVVFNLPNIGATPAATANEALVPGIKTLLTSVSQSYNRILNAGLAGNGGDRILPVNVYALLNEVLANPSAYGLVNITMPACITGSHDCNGGTLVAPGADQTYLFADGVHPTTATHAMLGQIVLSELRAPGQISLLGESQLANSTTQTRSVRHEMLADGFGSDSRVFVNVTIAEQRFGGTYSSPRTASNNVNLTIGGDLRLNDNLSAGVAVGLGHDTANVAHGGSYNVSDAALLAYLNYHIGGGYLGAYANGGHSNYTGIDRSFQIGPATRSESGSSSGMHHGAGLTGGWWFGGDALKTGPFANVEFQDVRINGYREHGNDSTSMWFGSQRRQALISTLGWRLQGQWMLGITPVSPFAELSWNHDSKAGSRDISAGLNTLNGNFAVSGFVPDKNWGSADLGLSAQLSPKITGWFDYNGHFSDHSQTYNNFNVGLKYVF